jgi:hypothetical protein
MIGRSEPGPQLPSPDWAYELSMPWGSLAVSEGAVEAYGLDDVPKRAETMHEDTAPIFIFRTRMAPVGVRLAMASERNIEMPPDSVQASCAARSNQKVWTVNATVPDVPAGGLMRMPQNPRRAKLMTATAGSIDRVVGQRVPDLLYDRIAANDDRSLAVMRAMGLGFVALVVFSDVLTHHMSGITAGAVLGDAALEGTAQKLQARARRQRDLLRPELRQYGAQLGSYMGGTLFNLLRAGTVRPKDS